ncbi:unnamed protein product [Prorocentrum cordatum]|uniref:Uncharacterized protein n=1 Tax=Prorocentrum cordatum TaxID=2364126 RepID=A0ABN9SCX9_9DINO|nr:unnamed protein product [Polarella glacialis]
MPRAAPRLRPPPPPRAAPPARPGAAAGAPPAGGSHGGRPSPRHSSCRRGGPRPSWGVQPCQPRPRRRRRRLRRCLRRSDGSAVACGDKVFGQCDVPALAAGGWKRPHGPAPERRRRRGLPAAGILSVCASSRRWWGGLTFAQVAAGGGYAALLESDGSAVACGLNREVQCDLLALVGGLAYAAHLLPALLLQASPDGDPVRFLTFSEAERCRVGAGPSAVLTDVCGQLAAEHRAGRPGPRDPWRGRCGLARWPMAGCSAAPWPGRRSAAPCAPGLPGGAAAPRSRGPHGIGGARRAGLRQSAAAGAPAGGVGRRARQRDRPRAVRGVLR